jgi:hypothetical protein
VFFRGVLGKDGVSVWCFDGDFVVECVAEVESKQCTFRRLKRRQDFEIYFSSLEPIACSGLGCGCAGCPGKKNIQAFVVSDFDRDQIRFLSGHPFVCRGRSYYQQA